jgi:hypothetical protein
MGLKFNIDRPKVTDEEIEKRKDFEQLVRRFREQSLKKARGDESWRARKLIRYTAIIAGVTVVCTVTYRSIRNSSTTQPRKHETTLTQQVNKTNKKSTAGPAIRPAAEKHRTPYSTYTVNASRGGELVHQKGSRIRVPKSGFVNKNGEEIVGDVTIEYREFHDPVDVLLNGVPMAYDSAGHAFNLETAGMFEIKGHQHGEPVFIRAERPIEVRLASRNADDRFNQYYLDTLQRNWKYLRRDNPEKLDRKATTRAMTTVKSGDTKREVITKTVDSLESVYNRRIASLPVVKKPAMLPKPTPGRPSFVLEGSYEEFPELAVFDKVVFEVGPENSNYTREIQEITWSDVKVTPGPQKDRNYILTLKYRNRTERLVVYPVIPAENYEAARRIHEQKLKEYEALAEKRAIEQQRLMAEMEAKQKAFMEEQRKRQRDAEMAALENARQESAALTAGFEQMNIQQQATRVFAVAQFGYYNSDCPHARPKGNSVAPVFVLHSSAKEIHPERIYVIDHRFKTVQEYAPNEKIAFGKEDDRFSVCALTRQRMYISDKNAVSSSVDKGSVHFEVKELPEKDDTPAALRKALEL